MTDSIIQFPVKATKLKEHSSIKQELLNEINSTTLVENIFGPNNNITRCDWGPGRYNPDRAWLKCLQFPLNEHLKQWSKGFNYETFTIHEIWFQQYAKEAKHSWHVHGCNFTSVYYLDLPEDTPKTQWLDPITGQECDFEVSEGDIITFPSWTIHRAPVNETDKIKTIISWNMDVDISDYFRTENDQR